MVKWYKRDVWIRKKTRKPSSNFANSWDWTPPADRSPRCSSRSATCWIYISLQAAQVFERLKHNAGETRSWFWFQSSMRGCQDMSNSLSKSQCEEDWYFGVAIFLDVKICQTLKVTLWGESQATGKITATWRNFQRRDCGPSAGTAAWVQGVVLVAASGSLWEAQYFAKRNYFLQVIPTLTYYFDIIPSGSICIYIYWMYVCMYVMYVCMYVM